MGALVSRTDTAIEAITSLDELAAFDDEWKALWQRCPQATPFQSPDWLLPLWRHLGEGDLWVIALRRRSGLIGVAPLLVFVHPQSGRRNVLFLGTPLADYSDLLVEPPFQGEAAAVLLSYLALNRSRWDCLDFQQLRRTSPLLKIGSPPGIQSEVMVQEVCPVLELPGEPGGLAASIPRPMWDRLHKNRRRLEKKFGAVTLDRVAPDDFAELFGYFLELHAARWQERGQPGVLVDPRLQQFHRESAQLLLHSGLLRFYVLRTKDRIIAAIYGFAHRGHCYYYLSGFDPSLHSFSPGVVLIGGVIEEAIAEGCTKFDFLRGQEAYKFKWGAQLRFNFRRLLVAS